MAKIYIHTFGCQMNKRDSEAVLAELIARGHQLVDEPSEANVVLLNTCSVRQSAELKAIHKMEVLIGDARAARRRAIFGFLGCMAQYYGAKLFEMVPGIQLVVGTHRMHRIPDYVDGLLSGAMDKVVDVEFEEQIPKHFTKHILEEGGHRRVTAYVNIMQGCNFRCTYCVVPTTRGKERYREMADILAECRWLADHGVREVTLLGQAVNRYGHGAFPPVEGKSPFVQLLEAIHQIPGIERIRFTAAHPSGYGDDLVEAYARLPRLMESAHIPVQSGSDRILRLMRRGYTRSQFIRIVRKLRSVKPDIGLITDLIVGFPGETDADFEDTVSLLKEIEFDQAFIFKFSPRPGTVAASLPDQVPDEVKEERHAKLLQLMNEIGQRRYSRLLGQRVEVLVEGPSWKNPERLTGRTRCNKIVVLEGGKDLIGQLLLVRVKEVGTFTLYGEVEQVIG